MHRLAPCVLALLFPVIASQDYFAQSPSVQTLSVGSTYKADCHAGQLLTRAVQWYKQQNRGPLQKVYTVRNYNIPEGRFSGQIDDKFNIYSLIVNEVQGNDSGVYYCTAKKSSLLHLIFGNGSKLLITGSPEIQLLTLPQDEIPSLARVPLLCLVRGLTPDSLPVRWNVSGRLAEGRSDSGTTEPDGTLTVGSHLSVSAETWRSGAVCTCAVPVNSTGNFISESISSLSGLPLHSDCSLWVLVTCSVVLLLLLMVTVTASWSCRTRQSGNTASDEKFTDSRPGARDKETLYAQLAFKADPTVRRERKVNSSWI